MADVDAIVIGGGVNGLAAALRLAEHGWSVCLLEASTELGGAARTVECTLSGFRHDLGAGFLPLAVLAPAIGGRELEPYGLRLRYAPVQAAHPFPDGRAATLLGSTPETAASLDRVSPGDGRVWADLAGRFGSATESLLRAQLTRLPVAEIAGLARRLGPSELLAFGRIAVSGAATVAAGFGSEEARAFFVAPAMHADLEPEMPGTAIYAMVMGLVGERVGMPVAEGGTGAVPAALAAALRAAGGTIETGRPVRGLLVERGRVTGVQTPDGPLGCRRAVVAAIDPRLVIRLAPAGALPAPAVRQVEETRSGPGTFKVDWALDGAVPWAAEPCRAAAVVHLADSVRAMSRAAWETAHGLVPARPVLIVGQQSLADPTRSPSGKHTLWAYARVPTCPRGDAARPRARGGWERAGKPLLERIEQTIEGYAPGFRQRILARAVWTPPDLERVDPNLIGGDISSGSFGLDQQLVFRPGPSWWRWRAPLAGLYLGGAGLPPGGGVHGACGDLAARQAIADHRRSRVVFGLVAVGAAGVLGSAGRAVVGARALRRPGPRR